jgi:DNA polymerase-3 subunit gamma/tau
MQDDRMGRSPEAEADLDLPLGPNGAAATSQTVANSPYRVLARKYRPARFEDLIGQDAMVRTLSNAFELGRIHQAYVLTGVRGVGKTTTARILARAFNYERPAQGSEPAIDRPTIHMPELGLHCQAIIESRHVDVIEMDAASHTGIDDVREIIANAQYRPMSARNKVYIIDEVHMLSKQAFNGLLKTLEEPPDHVKFVFATTEIEKVPVTVRSRCQRFDLRRIESKVLIDHLTKICALENVSIEPAALVAIARAAEGSVRDALSLLDQAIAHGGGGQRLEITTENVRSMLGVADRSRIVDLFELTMRGRIAEAFATIDELYDGGSDPTQILVDLADFVHLVTRLKITPAAVQDSTITPDEGRRGSEWATALSIAVLTRAWQLLVAGLADAKDSPRPLAAAHMVLVRLAYAADLPTPDEALRKLDALQKAPSEPEKSARSTPPLAQKSEAARFSAASAAPATTQLPASTRSASPARKLGSLADIAALASERRDLILKHALERDVRLVRFEPGRIELAIEQSAPRSLAQDLMRRLQEWTGERWIVVVSDQVGAATLQERATASAREEARDLEDQPLVKSVLARFPGAEIVAVRPIIAPEPAVTVGPTGEFRDDESGCFDEAFDDLDP